MFCTSIKNVTFLWKTLTLKTESVVVGLLWEKVTFLMSSSRMLQKIKEFVGVSLNFLQQTQEIVEKFASVAENH